MEQHTERLLHCVVEYKAIITILLIVSHPYVQQKQRHAGGDCRLFIIFINQYAKYVYIRQNSFLKYISLSL